MADTQEYKKDNGGQEKQEIKEERNCENDQQCEHIKRIKNALHFFNFISSDYNGDDSKEILIKYFEEDYTNLLSDCQHIFNKHNINDQLQTSKVTSCKIENCQIYIRNQQNRLNDKNIIFDQHLKFNMDILDNIHCYLLHSYDVGYCIDKEKWNEINTNNDNNDNKIEYVDEMMHKLTKYIDGHRKTNKVPRTTRPHPQRFSTLLPEITPSITPSNTPSNIVNNQYDEYDVISYYDLGDRYYYDTNTNDTNNKIATKQKYRNLKEEMLQNKICCLYKHLYDISYYKARKYLKELDIIKTMSSSINSNDKQILQYILSIILYCDYEELSAAFRETFKSNNGNNEYWNWSKVLIESVECFGNTLDKSKINIFYHYLISSSIASDLNNYYFTDFSLRFNAPTSTTSQLPVAIIYAADNNNNIYNNNNGIILELQKHSIEFGGTLKYIDCCLFSYHSNEKEQLFFGGSYPLKIYNMIEMDMKTKTNRTYIKIISALSLLDNVINGRPSDISPKEIKKEIYVIIDNLINYIIKGKENKFPSYINNIFRTFCDQKQKIIINLKYIDVYDVLLSDHFISNEIATKLVLISNIVQLFRKCTEIEILNKMDIAPLYLTQLLDENKSLWMDEYGLLKRIIFKDVELKKLEIKTLNHYEAEFRQNQYELIYNINGRDLMLEKVDLTKSDEYMKILKYAQQQFSKILIDKTCNDLLTECTECIAKDKDKDVVYKNCHSIQRMVIVLNVYEKLMKHKKLWRKVSLIPILTFKKIYRLTQINDDFFHIKDHIDDDDKFGAALFTKFKVKFKCDIDKNDNVCGGYGRYRYRLFEDKWNKYNLTNQDVVFQEECDKIHSYMIHPYDVNTPDNINIQNENKQNPGKGYVGRKEDDEWWIYQEREEKKENEDDDEEDEDKDDEEEIKTETDDQAEVDEDDYIYGQLIDNMGIFRWQCCHGFTSTQHEGLMHLKPKYKNVKEEALQNPYYRLSVDNWNQTLRKAQVFYKSFARHRITTKYTGKYDDKITQQTTKWKKKDCIDMQEIVTLKLYTDFDKLQFELKKCFRFETICDIFTLKNFNPNNIAKYKYNFDRNDGNIRYELEQRLCTFYWWRIRLLTVLNKYGHQLNNNLALYHGVNAKMILNNCKTQRLGFYGPLSTSASYHVARTFATAKGMVLQVTTQYPRLGFCRAFDASLISDYPEEKEHLIGFVYLRIITVLTRPLNKNWKTFHDIDDENNYYDIPLSSETRSIFFAIHLFRQQIFSMSVHLEYWLSSFLYLQCGFHDGDDNGRIKETNRCQQIQDIISKEKKYIKYIKYSQNKPDVNTEKNEKIKNDEINKIKQEEIIKILWKKLNNFRKYPNQKQVVKIDEISENLKPYFMDYVGENIRKKDKYIISFIKIIKIFENVKEIHFIDTYLFDNILLSKFIQFIHKYSNHKLRKIKFLYYDYDNNDKSILFHHPDNLDKALLNKLKQKQWEIKHKSIGKTRHQKEKNEPILNTGYEIKIYANCP